MKVLIATMMVMGSVVNAETICLARTQSVNSPNLKSFELTLEDEQAKKFVLVNTVGNKVSRTYTASGTAYTQRQGKLECLRITEEFQRARHAAALEGLKKGLQSGSELALIFLLPMGMAPLSTEHCSLLGDSRGFTIQDAESGPLGGELIYSKIGDNTVVMSRELGIVYHSASCPQEALTPKEAASSPSN